MSDIFTALSSVVKGMESVLNSNGFKAVYPEGVKKNELPAVTSAGKTTVDFSGEKGTLRLEHFDNKLALLYTDKTGDEASGSDFARLTLSLLEPGEADEKDLQYIAEEFSDSVNSKCGAAKEKSSSKTPTPVSKAAAKSGALSYDPNTLGSRFTVMFPELRNEYKSNVDRHGVFLAEDFFLNYGNKAVLEVIRQNDKLKMKKLFNMLNEIYEDGTNETQSLIAVTILGSLNKDQTLLANCVDYMSKDLCVPVIQVNKYLSSGAGKGARMRLENPPPYKPKKPKKKSAFKEALGL